MSDSGHDEEESSGSFAGELTEEAFDEEEDMLFLEGDSDGDLPEEDHSKDFRRYQLNHEFKVSVVGEYTEENDSVIHSEEFCTDRHHFQLLQGKLQGSENEGLAVHVLGEVEPFTAIISIRTEDGEVHAMNEQRFNKENTISSHVMVKAGERNYTVMIKYIPPPSETRYFFDSIGMINDGMICYLNSMIQSLFSIPCFRKAVYEVDPGEMQIPRELQRLFCRLQTSTVPVSSRKLTRAFGWSTEDLFYQQDAEELLRLMLDRLDDACKGTKISSMFEGKIKNFIRTADRELSSNIETFGDLSLPVKGINNLEESFTSYFETDQLTGRNQYQTDNGEKVDAEKGTELIQAPDVFCLQLRRFEYADGRMRKISSRFEFPVHFSKLGKDFTLKAFISHAGGSLGGHYVSYVNKGDYWLLLNDEEVIQLTEKEAVEDNFESSFTPYILFFVSDDVPNEEPSVPENILNTSIQITYMSINTQMVSTTDVKPNITKEELKEHFSKICSIPMNKIVLRELSQNGGVGEEIDDIRGVKRFFVDDSADVLVRVGFWVPGYNLLQLPDMHAPMNTPVKEFGSTVCKYFKIDPVPLLSYIYLDPGFVPFDGCITETVALYFQFESDVPINPADFGFELHTHPDGNSQGNLLGIVPKTIPEFIENECDLESFDFTDIDTTETEKVWLSPDLDIDTATKCISKVIGVDPTHIRLMIRKGIMIQVTAEKFVSLRSLRTSHIVYQVADHNITGQDRYEYHVLDESHEYVESGSVFTDDKSKLKDLIKEKLNREDIDTFSTYYSFPSEVYSPESLVIVVPKISIDKDTQILIPVGYCNQIYYPIKYSTGKPYFIVANLSDTINDAVSKFDGKEFIVCHVSASYNIHKLDISPSELVKDHQDIAIAIIENTCNDYSGFSLLPLDSPMKMKKEVNTRR